MKKRDFSKRLLVGLTGRIEKDWKSKLKEIEKHKIRKISLFLEMYEKDQRMKIYEALICSKVKEIPLVHIRHDMTKDELVFLEENFNCSHFNIHEFEFTMLKKWRGFYKKIFLEMNTDNIVPHYVNVRRIGGFCVDLSHFKREEESWTEEFEYILRRKAIKKYFACNHVNGYSYKRNKDLHTVRTLKDFEYLKTLPKFLFGKIIGIETFNPISEQLKFKKHLAKLLNNMFK